MTILPQIMSFSMLFASAILSSNEHLISEKASDWFNGEERLMWMNINGRFVASSDLSYSSHFLSNKEYLPFNIDFDLFYVDNINDKMYMMMTKHENLRVLEYNIVNRTIHIHDIHTYNDIIVLLGCNSNICSLYVHDASNVMYFATQSGYFYLKLNTMDFGRLLYDKNHISSQLTVYNDYLYYVVDGVGILRTKLPHDAVPIPNEHWTIVFIDQTSFNNEQITSFIIDRYRDIMYFSVKHHIYYVKVGSYYNKSPPTDINANFNASSIHSLEINSDGTMLFIQYSLRDKQYILNWPTLFGCTWCTSIPVLLHSYTVLYYYSSQTTASNNAQRHAFPRKLLAEFTVNSWQLSNVSLIRADSGMAIGYYNYSIFLIGGYNNPFQITEYNINNDTMVDHGSGTQIVATSTYGTGQFYTQLDDFLVMIDPKGSTISMYNLHTKEFNYNWGPVLPYNVASTACLCATSHYIFVIGGDTDYRRSGSLKLVRNDFQILNMSINEWFEGPTMQDGRASFSCNVHPVTMVLYAIGGIYQYKWTANSAIDTDYVTQTEIINVGETITGTWKYLDQLILPIYGHQSVVFGNYIIIIGGRESQTQTRIQTINCIDGSVNTAAGFLDYGVYHLSAIIVHHIIYAFGGRFDSGIATDQWQYSALPPTFLPTLSPTSIPSMPSNSPIQVPSLTPTERPNGCVNFDSLYYDNIDIDDHSKYYHLPSKTDSYIVYKGEERYKYYLKTITCSNTTNQCYVQCLAKESCTQLNIVPSNQLSSLLVICDDTKSCKESNLIIDNVNVDHVVLICTSSLSCNKMNVNINHNKSLPLQSLAVYCVDTFSCLDMEITINGQNSIKHWYNDYNIICESMNSCKQMILKEKDINVTIIMVRYSDNIRIINDIGFTDNAIICGLPSDIKTIKYDINDYEVKSEDIYVEVQSLYEPNKLPCEGVIYQCFDSIDTFCDVHYEFISPTTLIPIDYTSQISCYEINIKYLQNIVCNLNCKGEVKGYNEYYVLDVQYKYEMIFNVFNHCEEFFGDEHITDISLSRINQIFAISLNFYAHREYINPIQMYPKTVLLSNDELYSNISVNITIPISFSECWVQNDGKTSVSLKSHFQIETINDKHHYLFSEYSLFYNQTTHLLLDYFEFESIAFDIIINQTIINTETKDEIESFFVKYKLWIELGYTTFIVCVFGLMLLILYWKYKNVQKATMELKNPMVILLGIGDYDDDVKEPNPELVDLDIPDLRVDIDVDNLRSLFQDKLQYETMPKYQQHPKLRWTQHELFDLFNKQAKDLEDNISKYDGLILTISSHGMDNKIVTSDYKLVDTTAIHRIFSMNYPKSRNIPRIMMYDCCDMKIMKSKNKTSNKAKYDTRKYFRIPDIAENEGLSTKDKNPDYKLVTIHAANVGYQSKMSSSDGSYMITKFIDKTLNALKKNNNKFLFEIFDEIQDELGVNKQQIVCTYNNATRFIKFLKRNVEIEGDLEKKTINIELSKNIAIERYSSSDDSTHGDEDLLLRCKNTDKTESHRTKNVDKVVTPFGPNPSLDSLL